MYIVSTYLDDGRVFVYEVDRAGKAREHTHAICSNGYRHTFDGGLEHYPPHRIMKVKVTGALNSLYPDEVKGT